MKLFDLFFKKKNKLSDFPLRQNCKVVVDKPKHNFLNKDFKKLVNAYLKPKLNGLGFIGEGYFYYRLRNSNLETILIGTSPYGKAVCINVEIKKCNGEMPKLS